MNAPRVLVVGDVRPFGAGTLYCHALRTRGAEVLHLFDWLELEHYLTVSPRSAIYRLTRWPFPWDIDRHEQRIWRDASSFRPDLIINLKGLHWRSRFVNRLKTLASMVVNLNHDDFFSRYRSVCSGIQRSAIAAYDLILTTRRVNVAEVAKINPHVEFFPFAYSPEAHHRVEVSQEQRQRLSSDVVFVGTYAEHRAGMLEQLVKRMPIDLAIHGGGWEELAKNSPLRPLLRSRGVYLEDMCATFALAKVSLGFLRKENRDEYTQRSFEIPACGGVLLAERTPTHCELYREGVEAEFFDSDSSDELCTKVDRLIRDDAHRERVRAAGEAAVANSGNTYEDRAERLLEILREGKSRNVHRIAALPIPCNS